VDLLCSYPCYCLVTNSEGEGDAYSRGGAYLKFLLIGGALMRTGQQRLSTKEDEQQSLSVHL